MAQGDSVEAEIQKSQELMSQTEYNTYFKYFSDDPKIIEGIFDENKIRFTQPRALNDPLEFNPIITFHNNDLNYRFFNYRGYRLPSVEFFFRVQIIESQINSYGILSLTKQPDSFNMWTQYSNGHRGFMIEFKPSFNEYPSMRKKDGGMYLIKPIKYVDEYKICLDDLADESGNIPKQELLDELFFKKTSRWQHEKEYRMVRDLTDSDEYETPQEHYAYKDRRVYLFPFELDLVSQVFLGANMSVSNKTKILKTCEDHDIPVYQAHIMQDVRDRLGVMSTVIVLPVNDSNRELVLKSPPQLYCMNRLALESREIIEITDLNEIPYYEGHEKVVKEMLDNIIKGTDSRQ